MSLDRELCEEILMSRPITDILPLTAFFLTSKEVYPRILRKLVAEGIYEKAIRRLRGWEDFNKFYALQQFENIPQILEGFIQSYNERTSQEELEMGILIWPYEVLDAVINFERVNVKQLAFDLATPSYQRSLERGDSADRDHTNYAKAAVIAAARIYRENVEMALREDPGLEESVELLPHDAVEDFCSILEKVHTTKSTLHPAVSLETALIGFHKTLFKTLNEEDAEKVRERYYKLKQRADESTAYQSLTSILTDTIWKNKPEGRTFSQTLEERNFMTIAESTLSLPLSKSSIRNRVNGKTRKGKLGGIKVKRGIYVVNPRSFMWKIFIQSISSLKQSYQFETDEIEMQLVAPSTRRLPRYNGETWHTIMEASSLSEMPSPGTIRKYIKEHELTRAKALIGGRGEITVVPYSTVEKIRGLRI